MGQIKRQSFKNVVYLYAGALLGLATNLIFGNYLSEEQNGVLALIVAYGTIMGSTATLGYTFAANTYFSKLRDKEKGHYGYLKQSFKVGFLGLALVCVTFHFIAPFLLPEETNAAVNKVLFWFYPLALSALCYFLLEAFLRFNFNTTTTTLLKEFGQRIFILFFFVFFLLGWVDFKSYVALYVLAFLLVPFLQFIYLKMKGIWTWKGNYKEVPAELRRQIRVASLFGIVTNLGANALVFVDIIMINALLNTDATGVYVRNFYFATVILMASRAILGISLTHISEGFEQNDLKKVFEIYQRSCQTQAVVGAILFLLVWWNTPFVYWVLPKEYEAGIWVILLVGIGNVVNMATGTNHNVIAASQYYKANTYFTLALFVLAIAFNIIFIPIFGLTGAALATALSAVLFNLSKSIFIAIRFKMQPFNYKFVLFGIGLAVLAYLGYHLRIPLPVIWEAVLKSALVCLLFLALIYPLNISPDINQAIRKSLKFVQQRIG